jgi:hypothetical protein
VSFQSAVSLIDPASTSALRHIHAAHFDQKRSSYAVFRFINLLLDSLDDNMPRETLRGIEKD